MVRILIADDREMVRSALRQAIQQADKNWRISGEAGNGREAIDKAVELEPDLIILDVAMPVLDGIGATKEIRARLPEVPILIYTFMSFGHLEVMVKEAGAQAVVQKGDVRALIAEIRRVLPSGPMASGRAASDSSGEKPLSNLIPNSGEKAAPAGMDAIEVEIAGAAQRAPQCRPTGPIRASEDPEK
jgi:DNA-binding NarL/FixJ family response regulator